MHEIQQVQGLPEKYRALELQIVKVTAERDSVTYVHSLFILFLLS
jgi:hypothetical protein